MTPRCVRCGNCPEDHTLHYNWDPDGPICNECWLPEADQMIAEMEAETAWLQEREERDRECLG